MVLSTASVQGRPSARTVLLKSFDERGLVFFTQRDSAKGRALAQNPGCAVLFPWLELQRQVRALGRASALPHSEVDAYFQQRPRDSQLGAWASIEAGGQSRVVTGRDALDRAYVEMSERFEGAVPTPQTWGGYRVHVTSMEFWQGRHGRLHDRLRYRGDGTTWHLERLAP